MSMMWRYDPDMPIDTIMRRWPSTIAVLIRHRMLCVGCPITTFHTIPEICAAHDSDEAQFIQELAASIAVGAQLGEQDHAGRRHG